MEMMALCKGFWTYLQAEVYHVKKNVNVRLGFVSL